jgi:hypothetical protein
MTSDQITRVCYAASVGGLCALAFEFPASLLISVTIVLVANFVGGFVGAMLDGRKTG